MRKFFALVGFLMLSGTALAGNVPQYDIKSYCNEVATVGGGGSAVIERECRKEEKTALARLQRRETPAKTMRYCDEVASVGGGGSYMILEECIKQELEAEADL